MPGLRCEASEPAGLRRCRGGGVKRRQECEALSPGGRRRCRRSERGRPAWRSTGGWLGGGRPGQHTAGHVSFRRSGTCLSGGAGHVVLHGWLAKAGRQARSAQSGTCFLRQAVHGGQKSGAATGAPCPGEASSRTNLPRGHTGNREPETETERQRHREIERQRDRETDTEIQRYRETESRRVREAERLRDRETVRRSDRAAERQGDREKERKRESETERQSDR